MRDNPLVGLLLVFVPLSLLSIGGGPSILAGIQNAVEARAWMSQRDFLELFAIARAAPVPGVLPATLALLSQLVRKLSNFRGRNLKNASRFNGREF
jgi:chromate transport protein ChrA